MELENQKSSQLLRRIRDLLIRYFVYYVARSLTAGSTSSVGSVCSKGFGKLGNYCQQSSTNFVAEVQALPNSNDSNADITAKLSL